MSDLPICGTCGTQYATPQTECQICEDERQYVPQSGQTWTSLAKMRASGDYSARIEHPGEGLIEIGTEPRFGIGQRALLVQAASGNLLWDCVTYLDDEIVAAVEAAGGITGIAISHPHYYTTMVEWAKAFNVPIYLHEKDKDWIGRPDDSIELWSGDSKQLGDDLTLINLGVHFAGSTVLHWRDGAAGKGALLTGDIVQVIPDRKFVGFMYSYPNLIPERPSIVKHAAEILEPYRFEKLHGAWWNSSINADAHGIVQRSAKRYLEHARD
ncbi:MBL fold metallo-hydrolase [Amycolatopsis sp. YIM 10]|uniref:MBL fold metallo-hydrolase n=1 Tax=Amycolatopsis sp. YIM 10 TaxID=2653857 RepID=UPI0012903C22|nr:MBL fold metallo-hydrolase [Amycolatopsis sp. YIM 10]QFU86231.1 hypothetical protein YIM_05065 [Amycolatopsis sp. YIM 10]